MIDIKTWKAKGLTPTGLILQTKGTVGVRFLWPRYPPHIRPADLRAFFRQLLKGMQVTVNFAFNRALNWQTLRVSVLPDPDAETLWDAWLDLTTANYRTVLAWVDKAARAGKLRISHQWVTNGKSRVVVSGSLPLDIDGMLNLRKHQPILKRLFRILKRREHQTEADLKAEWESYQFKVAEVMAHFITHHREKARIRDQSKADFLAEFVSNWSAINRWVLEDHEYFAVRVEIHNILFVFILGEMDLLFMDVIFPMPPEFRSIEGISQFDRLYPGFALLQKAGFDFEMGYSGVDDRDRGYLGLVLHYYAQHDFCRTASLAQYEGSASVAELLEKAEFARNTLAQTRVQICPRDKICYLHEKSLLSGDFFIATLLPGKKFQSGTKRQNLFAA
ncbi:MAG: hypothetical protein ACE5R6_17925 [Candidatus Heimdallarchaeota archaeon]